MPSNDTAATSRFPDGFLWGVAAASYQVEGAAAEGGRTPSVWDQFARAPGRVAHGDTGDVACDQYHRYDEDSGLIADLGASAYRLSVSWSRVIPAAGGGVNDEGLDYYDRLVDSLLGRGVQPWVTLYHWDMPLWAYDRGGWLSREVCTRDFGAYAAAVAGRLGDRVRHWFTLNEPQVFLHHGHATGEHAPGLKLTPGELVRCAHHVLLAHGAATDALREHCQQKPTVGWAPVGGASVPLDPQNPADVEAARKDVLRVPPRVEGSRGDGWMFNNSWYADAIIEGHYPEDGLRHHGHNLPAGWEKDMELIHRKPDFYGVNIYQGRTVKAGEDGEPVGVPHATGGPRTAFDWPVTPEALYWGTRLLHERYGLPMYVTENGCAAMDWVHVDGKVHDAPRVDFLCRYLLSLRRAAADGADVRGYFQWSILDNFEWAEGYDKRFGLVHVDYATQKRTPKDSYHWYAEVIRTNGASLPGQVEPLR